MDLVPIVFILTLLIIIMFIRNLIKSSSNYKMSKIHSKYKKYHRMKYDDECTTSYYFEVIFDSIGNTKIRKIEVDSDVYTQYNIGDKIVIK